MSGTNPSSPRMLVVPEPAVSASSLLGLGGVRSDFRLALRVRQRPELRRDPARNRGRFTAGLEAREIGAIAPRKRTAQPDAGLDGRIVHDVDRALVVWRALAVARE